MPTKPPIFRPSWLGERKQTVKQSDARRGSASSRGYGYKWKVFARAYLLRHPLCVECKRNDRYEPATDVDHVIPHKGDLTVFWKGPFQALCHACHSAKTARGE